MALAKRLLRRIPTSDLLRRGANAEEEEEEEVQDY
jgi:hypothetical protein